MVKKLTTQQILDVNLSHEAPEKLKSVKIILHNIRSLHNVGSVFRSSDAFGISEIMLSGYTPTPPRSEITKTALGAEDFVPWTYWNDTTKLIEALKEQGCTLVGLEQTDNSIPLTKFNIHEFEKICLIMGNEITGIDEDFLPHIDCFVNIPQFGQKHSLNVSVATAVTLYAILEKLSQ